MRKRQIVTADRFITPEDYAWEHHALAARLAGIEVFPWNYHWSGLDMTPEKVWRAKRVIRDMTGCLDAPLDDDEERP